MRLLATLAAGLPVTLEDPLDPAGLMCRVGLEMVAQAMGLVGLETAALVGALLHRVSPRLWLVERRSKISHFDVFVKSLRMRYKKERRLPCAQHSA